MDINPGNATVSKDGRIFASIHQFRDAPVRLVEIKAPGSYEPFPNKAWNEASRPAHSRLVSPLGVKADSRGRLWVIDNGNEGDVSYPPKLLAFDIKSRKLLFRRQLPASVAKPGSFPQDIALDEKRGVIYIADVGKVAPPAIIVVNMRGSARRVEGIPGLEPENVDMKVDGRTLVSPDGKGPARIGLNPITLSADGETLYFGAMNGTSWYALPTAMLRSHAPQDKLSAAVRRVGPKPVSDGAATDAAGNHYFTDVNNNAIAMLTSTGKLKTIAEDDDLLSWPDSISIGPDGKLYVAVNQLHRTAFFNRGRDEGRPPYRIVAITPPGVAAGVPPRPCGMQVDNGICLLTWRDNGANGKQDKRRSQYADR
jgi:sugar lactone lactonase YvrE